MVFIKGNLNGIMCLDILDENLILSVNTLNLGRGFIKRHTASITQKALLGLANVLISILLEIYGGLKLRGTLITLKKLKRICQEESAIFEQQCCRFIICGVQILNFSINFVFFKHIFVYAYKSKDMVCKFEVDICTISILCNKANSV